MVKKFDWKKLYLLTVFTVLPVMGATQQEERKSPLNNTLILPLLDAPETKKRDEYKKHLNEEFRAANEAIGLIVQHLTEKEGLNNEEDEEDGFFKEWQYTFSETINEIQKLHQEITASYKKEIQSLRNGAFIEKKPSSFMERMNKNRLNRSKIKDSKEESFLSLLDQSEILKNGDDTEENAETTKNLLRTTQGKLTDAQKEIETLKNELKLLGENYKNELKSLVDQIESLKKLNKKPETEESEQQTEPEEESELKEKIAKLQTQLVSNNQTLEEKGKSLQEATKQLERLTAELQASNEVRHNLNSENNALKEKNTEFEKTVAALNAGQRKANEELEKLSNEISEEKDKNQKSQENLQSQIQKSKENSDALTAQIKERQTKINKAIIFRDGIKKEIEDFYREYMGGEGLESNTSGKTLQYLKGLIEKILTKIKEEKEKTDEVRKEINNFKEKEKITTEENTKLKEDYLSQQNIINELHNKIRLLEGEKEKSAQNPQDLKESCTEITNLNQRIKNLEDEKEKSSKTIQDLNEKLREKEIRNPEISTKSDTIINEQQKEIFELKELIKQLEQTKNYSILEAPYNRLSFLSQKENEMFKDSRAKVKEFKLALTLYGTYWHHAGFPHLYEKFPREIQSACSKVYDKGRESFNLFLSSLEKENFAPHLITPLIFETLQKHSSLQESSQFYFKGLYLSQFNSYVDLFDTYLKKEGDQSKELTQKIKDTVGYLEYNKHKTNEELPKFLKFNLKDSLKERRKALEILQAQIEALEQCEKKTLPSLINAATGKIKEEEIKERIKKQMISKIEKVIYDKYQAQETISVAEKLKQSLERGEKIENSSLVINFKPDSKFSPAPNTSFFKNLFKDMFQKEYAQIFHQIAYFQDQIERCNKNYIESSKDMIYTLKKLFEIKEDIAEKIIAGLTKE